MAFLHGFFDVARLETANRERPASGVVRRGTTGTGSSASAGSSAALVRVARPSRATTWHGHGHHGGGASRRSLVGFVAVGVVARENEEGDPEHREKYTAEGSEPERGLGLWRGRRLVVVRIVRVVIVIAVTVIAVTVIAVSVPLRLLVLCLRHRAPRVRHARPRVQRRQNDQERRSRGFVFGAPAGSGRPDKSCHGKTFHEGSPSARNGTSPSCSMSRSTIGQA
jgi:hypothetical protein